MYYGPLVLKYHEFHLTVCLLCAYYVPILTNIRVWERIFSLLPLPLVARVSSAPSISHVVARYDMTCVDSVRATLSVL